MARKTTARKTMPAPPAPATNFWSMAMTAEVGWRIGRFSSALLLCQLRLHPPPGAPRSVPSGLPCTAGSGQDHLETFNFTAWFLSTSLQRISYTSIKYPLFFPLFPVITTIEYIEVKTINIPKCVILKRKTLFHF